MILSCNFEELTALKHGAEAVLQEMQFGPGVVVAPPENHRAVEVLKNKLEAELSVRTLEELRELRSAVETVVRQLRIEMETAVVQTHPADESAVSAYFEFAHVISFLARVRGVEDDMIGLIELLTGSTPTPKLAKEVDFPD